MLQNWALASSCALAAMLMGSTGWGQETESTVQEESSSSRVVEADGTVVTTEVVTRTEDFAMDMRPFGTAGQVTFGISRIGGLYYTRNTLQDGGGNDLPIDQPNEFGLSLFIGGTKDTTNLGLTIPRLSLDVFVTDNLSIGGGPIFGYKSSGNQTPVDPASVGVNQLTEQVGKELLQTTLPPALTDVEVREIAVGGEVRIGYTFVMGRWVIWPRAGVELVWDVTKTTGKQLDLPAAIQGQTTYAPYEAEQRLLAAWVELEMPVLFTLTDSFYAGFVPTFDIPFLGNLTDQNGHKLGKAKALNMAGLFTWGGYFHLL